MEFTDLDYLFQVLANYYFGSYMILGIALWIVIVFFLNSNGFNFNESIILTLPFLAFMILPTYLNWFSSLDKGGFWILCLVLIFVAFMYANGIKKIMG